MTSDTTKPESKKHARDEADRPGGDVRTESSLERQADAGTNAGNIVTLPARRERSTTQTVTDFVREHPLLCVAGGLAAGAVAAAMLPRRTKHRIADRASHWAEVISAASVMLGQQALNRAEAAGGAVSETASALADRAERLGSSARDKAGHWGGVASEKASRLVADVDSDARRVGGKLAERAGEIRDRLRH